MRVTMPTLSWDPNYRLEEKAEEDNYLFDEIYEKLDACLDEYNYIEDEYYYIAHPKIIKKYPDEDENLINKIEDLLISAQEAVVDNIGAEMYDVIDDDIIDDDVTVFDVDYDLTSLVIDEDLLTNQKEQVSIEKDVVEEIADVIVETDDVLIDFDELSPSKEKSSEYDSGKESQVIEIFPDPLQPDDPEPCDDKTILLSFEIDEQKHIIEDQPYTTVEGKPKPLPMCDSSEKVGLVQYFNSL